MPQFEREATDDIEALRELLTEKYGSDKVFRELLQNADDSQATHIHFSILPPDMTETNPLLSVPGLLVLNNGVFRAGDAKGIASLRSGTKTADAAAIGKFGLGLKSVFHFGEAFFYAASTNQPGARDTSFLRLLNPWGDMHRHWEEAEPKDLWARISAVATQCLGESSLWFAVYVPLRTDQKPGEMSPIVPFIPDPQKLFTADGATALAKILPMLQHVTRITFAEPSGELQEITLVNGASRRCGPVRWESVSSPIARSFEGVVRMSRSHASGCDSDEMRYGGLETCGSVDHLSQLKKEKDWPRRFSTHPQTGLRDEVVEKAEPHAAVLFLRTPSQGNGSTFRLREAVFMPLDKEYNQPGAWIDFDTEVVLHGYYFLDSGRQRRLTKNNDPVRGEWNETLLRDVALPRLLPAFASYVRDMPEATQTELTKRLKGVAKEAFPDARMYCGQSSWVGCATLMGKVSWQLLPATADFYELPDPPAARPELPFLLFPGLAADAIHVTWAHLPRLSTRTPADLAAIAGKFVGTLNADLLVKDEAARSYLETLLRAFGKQLPLAVWASLWKSLALAMTPEVIASVVNPLAQFVARTISYLPDASADTKRGALAEIALFRVYELGDNDEDKGAVRLASWNDLAACRESGTLFTSTGREVADALRNALAPPSRVLRVAESSVPGLLFGESHGTKACDASACLTLLRDKKPLLKPSPSDRLPLLRKLLPDKKTEASHWRKELRYLLHGDRDAFDAADFALFAPPRGSDVWSRLMNALMRAQNVEQRVIDPILLAPLSNDHKDALGIAELTPQAVGDALSKRYESKGAVGLADLPWKPDSDAVTVLNALGHDKRLERVKLWKALPLHQTMDGTYISLDGKEFVCRSREGMTETLVPTPARSLIVSLREPDDKNLAACYDTVGIKQYHPSLVVEAICATGKPQDFRELLLPMLSQAYANAPIPNELRNILRKGWWLSRKNATPLIAPDDVIHLPGLEDALARLLSSDELRGSFYDTRAVASSVRDHKAWLVIERDLLPNEETSFQMLAECVSDNATFALGMGRVGVSAEALLAAFAGETAEPWNLLRTVSAWCPARAAELIKTFHEKSLAPERRAKYLLYLQDNLERGLGERSATEVAFRFFLGQVETAFELRKCRVLLRSAAGTWRDPAMLCHPDEDGIGDDDRVDNSLFTAIEPILSPGLGVATPQFSQSATTRDPPWAVGSDAARAVADYFAAWNIERETIGAFLTVLASDPAFVSLAKDYAGIRDIDVDRREMNLPLVERGEITFSVRVQEEHQTTHPIPNLWRDFIEVAVAGSSPGIFLGKPKWSGIGVKDRVTLSFRQLAGDGERTSKRLQVSLESLLSHLEGALKAEHWEQLCQPDRTKLATAQTLILRSLPFYANQLKKDGWKLLRPVLRRLDDLRYREEQARDVEWARRNVQTDVDACQNKLRDLLENDKDAQREILGGVQQKVAQYQYTADCVPFELFQNADDACVERDELDKVAPKPRFVIEAHVRGIAASHNGRPINRYRGKEMDAEEGQLRGFHRDLEKMLVLSFSDKNDGADAEAVTGKFGLGFKSVFLVTDAPIVLSDALGFRVAGGVYPVELKPNAKNSLEAYRESVGFGKDATVIQLPLRVGDDAHVDIMARFGQSLPYLLAFARQIKSARVGRAEHAWVENEEVATGVFLGESGADKCLVVRGTGGAALLLKLGARGIEPLPEAVPTFWVTAPTLESTHTGYAINAPFLVDVGRAQLAADSAANVLTADALAGAVAAGLTALFDCPWDTTVSRLKLAADAMPYAFWDSVWERLTVEVDGSDGAKTLVSRVVHGAEGKSGYARFLRDRAALPSGLPGAHQTLLKIGDVKRSVTGILADSGQFARVSEWHGFAEKFGAGGVVSDSVAARLRTWGVDHESLGIVDVLKALCPNGIVKATQAAQFGRVITRDSMKGWSGDEVVSLRRYLHALTFLPTIGRQLLANELLLDIPAEKQGRDQGDAGDKRLRVGFAPPENVLHADYMTAGESAISFVLACRDNQQHAIESKTLAGWGRDAHTADAKIAFLLYLLNGTLAKAITTLLRASTELCWLDAVKDEPFWHTTTFTEFQKVQLAGLLESKILIAEFSNQAGGNTASDDYAEDDYYEENSSGNVVQTVPTSEVPGKLKRFADDWAAHSADQLSRYDWNRYPDADTLFSSLKGDMSATSTREAWITLLLSASLESIGRAKPEQHKGFLMLGAVKDWIQCLAAADSGTDTVVMLRPFERWLDDAVEKLTHVRWLKEMLPSLLLSRYIEEYAHAFLGLDSWREDTPFPMIYVNAPRTSPTHADSPPLQPFLGIGTHYVLRELLRKGVLTNPRLHSAAFVMGGRVRKWANERGAGLQDGDSHEVAARGLHDYLCKHLGPDAATFGGAFDLAIRLQTEN